MKESPNLLCEIFEGLAKLVLRPWRMLVAVCGHDGSDMYSSGFGRIGKAIVVRAGVRLLGGRLSAVVNGN